MREETIELHITVVGAVWGLCGDSGGASGTQGCIDPESSGARRTQQRDSEYGSAELPRRVLTGMRGNPGIMGELYAENQYPTQTGTPTSGTWSVLEKPF